MDPAVAATRVAVRTALADVDAGDLVLVAVSGGADSLALAAAAAAEAPRCGLRAGAVTVDHALQPGSAARADAAAGRCRELGLEPVEIATVSVAAPGGPEAAARDARYVALEAAAERLGASRILLGHTLDDQAETVLLGLARGSGARSLAGMAARRGRLLRPFLGVRRATTEATCRALDLTPWEDPHNGDPSFARARVRSSALPVLEDTLGPGVAEALARTADLLRDDADALDGWADRESEDPLDVARLAAMPAAVRTRVLRREAVLAGARAGELSAGQVQEIARLVTDWHGQGAVSLPGGLVAERTYDRLSFR
ncbi:MAG TPA: tRNA lysidine(34) synthetase TilS [Mycobacteriales bacterium]|jgi:tRNA(Ile)-lysidine synthase|nr:tRNA lysidine(34) synthetase TilS [Mycobacteriales bacterium]